MDNKFKVGDRVKFKHFPYFMERRNLANDFEVIEVEGNDVVKIKGDQYVSSWFAHNFELIKEEKMADFKVGDKVKCIDGEYTPFTNGQILTIESISDGGEWLRFPNKGGWFKTRFELVKEAKEAKFKVGDKVKCINANFSRFTEGKILTVTSVDIDGEYLGFDCEAAGWDMSRFELTPAELLIPQEIQDWLQKNAAHLATLMNGDPRIKMLESIYNTKIAINVKKEYTVTYGE